MDNAVLKKRLSTFRNDKGRYSKISDDVIVDVLRAWETWAGSARDLQRELGLSKMQLATVIQKGKKLVKKGHLAGSGEFKELKLDSLVGASSALPIEVNWDKGKVIRFSQVDALVDFLKKVA
jgi:hypothetical protein